MRSHSALLCDQWANQRRFLTGDIPGLADANAYFNLWFLRSAFPSSSLYQAVPRVAEWVERVSAIGDGQRSELARSSEPLASTIAPHDAELEGAQVTIAADDYGRGPVRGVLVGSSDHDVSIGREDPQAGKVVVHFPHRFLGPELTQPPGCQVHNLGAAFTSYQRGER